MNSAGNALVLNDTTGNTAGTLTVGGTAAVDLGVAGTYSSSTVSGSSLHLRVLSNNTLLSTLGGGTGFKGGLIKLTSSAVTGNTFTVDLSSPTLTTLGDVLQPRSTPIRLASRPRLIPTGNGILHSPDSSKGPNVAKVEEVNGGSTATSLNILGIVHG